MYLKPKQESPPYSAIAVANSFIKIAWEQGEQLTPLKLQKLVYIAHGWHLAIYNQPLIRHRVEAWKYGPVIPVIYQQTRMYGAEEITEYLRPDPFSEDADMKIVPEEDHQTWRLFRRIWSAYGSYNGIQLSAMTHQKGTPWYTTWHEGNGSEMMGTDIDTNLIRQHFIDLSRNKPNG